MSQKKSESPSVDSIQQAKEWIRKSGFPLENDVYAILQKCVPRDITIIREVPFFAEDENSEKKLRSVDFVTSPEFSARTLNHNRWNASGNSNLILRLFIDAKFSTDEMFMFVPSHERPSRFDTAFPALVPYVTEDDFGQAGKHYSRDEIRTFCSAGMNWPLAVLGRKIRETERESLASYAIQMIQVVSEYIRNDFALLGKSTEERRAQHRDIYVYVPLVVTNAKMFLVNQNLTSEALDKADSPDSLYKRVNFVRLKIPNIFHVLDNLALLSKTVSEHKNSYFGWNRIELEKSCISFVHIDSLETAIKSIHTRLQALAVPS